MRQVIFLLLCGITALFLVPSAAAAQPRHGKQQHRHHHRRAARLAEVSTTTDESIDFPDVLVHQPTEPHTATIIVLHGLGQQADVWASWGESYGPELPYAKWIWPKAPQRKITARQAQGPARPGWYDIISWPWGKFPLAEEDEEGIAASSRFVQDIIDGEVVTGIPYKRIVLVGFSQGGALALAKLRDNVPPLAGIVALSTYLPLAGTPPLVSDQQLGTPVLFNQGNADDVVEPSIAEESAQLLDQAGANVTFTMYNNLGHWVNDGEMADVVMWWQDQLPPVSAASLQRASANTRGSSTAGK